MTLYLFQRKGGASAPSDEKTLEKVVELRLTR
jgi:hypothetical protein